MPDEEVLATPHIPALDFRGFDHDELLLLAKGYREDPFHLLVPRIDRSLFNESASSKMQTFQSMCDDDSSEDRGGGGGGEDISEVCVMNKSEASWRESRDRRPLDEAEALSEHILEMQGTWISPSRQEKLVAAKGFPEGWTVIVRLRWREERCYLEFRDYKSPDGRSWPSFKAAASYLISNLDNIDLAGILDSTGKAEDTVERETASEQNGEAGEFVDIESGTEEEMELIDNNKKRKRTPIKQKKLDDIPETQETFHVENGDAEKTQQEDDTPKVAEQNEQAARNSIDCQAQQNCGRLDTAGNHEQVHHGCGKIFGSKSQYWGHQSVHAKKRRRREAIPEEKQEEAQTFSSLVGWLDEGCQECKISVLGNELSICSWCEKEYHLSCVGRSAGETLPPHWTCPACILL
ncbi:uncharacterized protein LOC112342056 isoform X2 [Selaginella moellendorffii]|uniref:uncharacterized protein LOC112342056 isoform X2 n=1 Tax=Selaginella moellendorffii TaxID=88036 RepID=UPI000D1C7D51|nr:uncharacterized protein LOC112342056 isoform X2 [Selaginella moellendorffii]|eukprot:XP_024518995.1 uncharacterized protein LOC112342056 isoform X2 [Selaginella moellendorffii]